MTLPRDARELIAERYDRGRRERGWAEGEPFRWDRLPVGMDEAEEAADLVIYREQRYICWYGRNRAAWPFVAQQRLADAERSLQELLHELRCGPIDVRDPAEIRS